MSDAAPRTFTTAGSSRGPASVELLTRVASMYYLGDMTQETIAANLGLSRPKVGRLLTQAQEAGLGEISGDQGAEAVQYGHLGAWHTSSQLASRCCRWNFHRNKRHDGSR